VYHLMGALGFFTGFMIAWKIFAGSNLDQKQGSRSTDL
jgi:hypothetical protein